MVPKVKVSLQGKLGCQNRCPNLRNMLYIVCARGRQAEEHEGALLGALNQAFRPSARVDGILERQTKTSEREEDSFIQSSD